MPEQLPKCRVVMAWPGGPGRGVIITPANGIRERLLRGGYIELVDADEQAEPPHPVAGQRATRKGRKG